MSYVGLRYWRIDRYCFKIISIQITKLSKKRHRDFLQQVLPAILVVFSLSSLDEVSVRQTRHCAGYIITCKDQGEGRDLIQFGMNSQVPLNTSPTVTFLMEDVQLLQDLRTR
eukprot:m.157718 g.157718  ORF g.157718 m.157718 type:complete len:112 (+) comp15122_c0_seq13:1306-1641(+)